MVMGGIGTGLRSLDLSQGEKEKAIHIIRKCIDKAMKPECTFFDAIAWEEEPLPAIDSSNHHLAYFGYLNMLLSMHRYQERQTHKISNVGNMFYHHEYAELNNRITQKLIKAFVDSDCGLLQTYPSQAITTDNAAAIGSIGLYYKALGKKYTDTVLQIIQKFKKLAVDPQTGLLNYYIDYKTGEPDGTLRGSGTALAMYFLAFADTSLSKFLYQATVNHLKDTVYGTHGIREYLRDGDDPLLAGDTDTGPIVYGIGMSATGFTIAGSIMFRDKMTYDDLTLTAWLFGLPVKKNGGTFIGGDATQNAMMLSILHAKKIQ
jgi:hypothetical protein